MSAARRSASSIVFAKSGANHILADFDRLAGLLGYSRPRVAETEADIRALPAGAVIRDAITNVGELGYAKGVMYVFWAGNECEDELAEITLPATVLRMPEEAK